jgi:peptide methionine sulfoxide reductase MsrB
MLYDIADDFRKNGGRNNFTLNHLAERIKYYIDESFEYRITEISLNSGEGVLDL